MLKPKLVIIFIISLILMPAMAVALEMPKDGNQLADMAGINAQAYVVEDAVTGQALISKNADILRVPASLTKLVTALVVLDTKPKLYKTVAMTADDQVIGQCLSGGACIKAKAGVKFTVDALFHALLLPSANNAANALARSTGLTPQEFADSMNQKAAALGAARSSFYEPTGLDPNNQITAADYAKIVAAAFSNAYLRKIASLNSYYLRSSNNFGYNQTIKNTDKLLSDSEVQILGAKTGYLNESGYNFSALLKTAAGQKLAVVVLGESHLSGAFAETKLLASLADTAQALALGNSAGVVLGANTQ